MISFAKMSDHTKFWPDIMSSQPGKCQMAGCYNSLWVYTSSNPGSTHFWSWTEFQSTNDCGLSQSGLQSGLGGGGGGIYTLSKSLEVESRLELNIPIYTGVLIRFQSAFSWIHTSSVNAHQSRSTQSTSTQSTWIGIRFRPEVDWIRFRTPV